MSRNLPYSRQALRNLFRAWLTRNRWPLTGVSLLVLVGLPLETFAVLGPGNPGPWRGFVAGFLDAAVLGGILTMVYLSFLAHEAQAIRQLRGAWGEENTREELRAAKRRNIVWGWVDSVSLAIGDIDHIVVTRGGGLIVIDSKWRYRPDQSDRDQMVQSARLAARRAEGVVRSLVSRERGDHRRTGDAIAARPVVVLWGAAQSHLPPNVQVEGVDFVAGRDLRRWLRSVTGETVDEDAARDLLRRIEEFRKTSGSAVHSTTRSP